MAATITHSAGAMPTAVITLSSEKMMSITMICAVALNSVGCRPRRLCSSWCSTFSKISWLALNSRNRPPAMSTTSRPENGLPQMWNHGVVRPAIQASVNSSASRLMSAAPRPIR